jgi:hypothetical protein
MIPRARRCGNFDSQHEALCYIKLHEVFLKEQIKVHHKIELTDSISWVIDFRIAGENPIYVEAKGYPTEGFDLRLRLLQDLYPEIYERTFLVFADKKNREKYRRKCPRTMLLNDVPHTLRGIRGLNYTPIGENKHG